MKTLIITLLICAGTGTIAAQENLYRLRSDLISQIDSPAQTQEATQVSRKSAATAILYSLLLPGMGELYADGFDEGRYSLIAEGGLWLTYLSFRQYGSWIRNDARNFASAHAGAQQGGKNDQYFVNLGNFNDTYEYNEKQLRDRELDNVYDVTKGYYWKWDNEVNRKEYRAMRVSTERVFNNSRFVIGGIIVNRILSAINAVRLTRMYNQRTKDELGSWWLESSLIQDGLKPDGLKVSIVRRF